MPVIGKIAAFERSGVVVKSTRGNQVLYSINTGNPIYGEPDVVARELEPFRDRIEMAFVFGSVAVGNDRPGSDVDLMVVADIDVFDLGEAVQRLEKALGRTIDLNIHTPEEWARLADDCVVRSVAKGPKIILMGRCP